MKNRIELILGDITKIHVDAIVNEFPCEVTMVLFDDRTFKIFSQAFTG